MYLKIGQMRQFDENENEKKKICRFSTLDKTKWIWREKLKNGKMGKSGKIKKLKGSFFNFPSITFASFCVNAQNQFHCTCQTFRLTTNKNEWEMHKKSDEIVYF